MVYVEIANLSNPVQLEYGGSNGKKVDEYRWPVESAMRNFPMKMLLDGGISSLFPNGSVTDSHGDIAIGAADADEIFCREAVKSADHSLGIVNRYYLHDFRGGVITEDKLQSAPFAGGITTTLQTLNSYNLSIKACRKLHTDANGPTYSYGDAGAWSAQKLEEEL